MAVHALFTFSVLFVFVDPLGPVSLNLGVSGLFLGDSWPVFSFLILLDDVEQDVSAFNVPCGSFLVNFSEEIEI